MKRNGCKCHSVKLDILMQQYSLPSINMLVSHDTGKAHVNLRTRLYTNTQNTFSALIIIVCLRHNNAFPLCLITIAITGPIVSIKHQLAQWLAPSIQPTNLCVNNSVDLELISLHHLLSIITITHQRHHLFLLSIFHLLYTSTTLSLSRLTTTKTLTMISTTLRKVLRQSKHVLSPIILREKRGKKYYRRVVAVIN